MTGKFDHFTKNAYIPVGRVRLDTSFRCERTKPRRVASLSSYSALRP